MDWKKHNPNTWVTEVSGCIFSVKLNESANKTGYRLTLEDQAKPGPIDNFQTLSLGEGFDHFGSDENPHVLRSIFELEIEKYLIKGEKDPLI